MNIEERITLSRSPFMKFISEVEVSPFLDLGTVFPELSKLSSRNLKWGPGIAQRFKDKRMMGGELPVTTPMTKVEIVGTCDEGPFRQTVALR